MKPLSGDFPHQFRGKKRTEALLKVIREELEELEKAREQLAAVLCVDTAHGEQLDRIGEIVVLSRAQAGLLATQGGSIDFDVIDDERYRKYLKYKILANTSHSTYYDIITAVKTIWDVDKVSYNENTDGPASLTVSFPYEYKPGEDIFLLPPLVAAGVGINIRAETTINTDCSPLRATAFSSAILQGRIGEKSVVSASYPVSTKLVPLTVANIVYTVKEKEGEGNL